MSSVYCRDKSYTSASCPVLEGQDQRMPICGEICLRHCQADFFFLQGVLCCIVQPTKVVITKDIDVGYVLTNNLAIHNILPCE